MKLKRLDKAGLATLWAAIKSRVADALAEAKDYADGKAGASVWGVTEKGGIYSPSDLTVADVGANSALVSQLNNMHVGDRNFVLPSAQNISLRASAPAGSTSYEVANTYANRIALMVATSGKVCVNNTDENPATVTSVTVDGTALTPNSASASPIVINTETSANPNAATNSIRIFGDIAGFGSLAVGVSCLSGKSDGYNVLAGQQVYASGNANAVFGNSQYCAANSSLLAGRQHVNTKSNAFLAGHGHDTTNGAENVAAVGKFSNITGSTAFAVGGGTSENYRRNLFEVNASGQATASGPTDDAHLATKLYVDAAIAAAALGGSGATTGTTGVLSWKLLSHAGGKTFGFRFNTNFTQRWPVLALATSQWGGMCIWLLSAEQNASQVLTIGNANCSGTKEGAYVQLTGIDDNNGRVLLVSVPDVIASIVEA